MKISISNQSKYDIEIKYENQRYLLKNNSVQEIIVSSEPLFLSACVCDEIVKADTMPKKLLKTLSNMILCVGCTYEITSICDGMKLDVSDELFTYSGEAFFLPFSYLYTTVKASGAKIELIDCGERNAKEVLKLYRQLALVAHVGGDGIIVGALSAMAELGRARRLCSKEKISITLNKGVNKPNDNYCN